MEELRMDEINSEMWKKIKSIKSWTKMSLHHIIAKSRKGYNVDNTENHLRIENSLHEKIHSLFYNLLPHEQFALLYMINKNVLSEETKEHFAGFNMDNFYKNNLVKNATVSKWGKNSNFRS